MFFKKQKKVEEIVEKIIPPPNPYQVMKETLEVEIRVLEQTLLFLRRNKGKILDKFTEKLYDETFKKVEVEFLEKNCKLQSVIEILNVLNKDK